jgi:hypothetical protein
MASGTARYRYEADTGNIFYTRTDDDPELESVRGAQPTGSITENLTFKVSKNSGEVGCKPRHCILTLKTDQSVSDCLVNPNAARKTVVVLKKDHVPPIGTEITVNGRKWIVGSVIGEQMR